MPKKPRENESDTRPDDTDATKPEDTSNSEPNPLDELRKQMTDEPENDTPDGDEDASDDEDLEDSDDELDDDTETSDDDTEDSEADDGDDGDDDDTERDDDDEDGEGDEPDLDDDNEGTNADDDATKPDDKAKEEFLSKKEFRNLGRRAQNRIRSLSRSVKEHAVGAARAKLVTDAQNAMGVAEARHLNDIELSYMTGLGVLIANNSVQAIDVLQEHITKIRAANKIEAPDVTVAVDFTFDGTLPDDIQELVDLGMSPKRARLLAGAEKIDATGSVTQKSKTPPADTAAATEQNLQQALTRQRQDIEHETSQDRVMEFLTAKGHKDMESMKTMLDGPLKIYWREFSSDGTLEGIAPHQRVAAIRQAYTLHEGNAKPKVKKVKRRRERKHVKPLDSNTGAQSSSSSDEPSPLADLRRKLVRPS